jgi:hypothetical protein
MKAKKEKLVQLQARIEASKVKELKKALSKANYSLANWMRNRVFCYLKGLEK